MIVYQVRSGIVLTQICGQNVLIAEKALKNSCPYVTVINETSAYLWDLLKERCSLEKLNKAVQKAYAVSENETIAEIKTFIAQMKELGYLEEYDV